MEKLIHFSKQAESRDKFFRVLQYASRLAQETVEDPGLYDRFNGLFTGIREARKLFRLAKSIHELQPILTAYYDESIEKETRIYLILSRLSYCCYWLFDNIQVLCSVKFMRLKRKVFYKSFKLAKIAWVAGILFTLATLTKRLNRNYALERKNSASTQGSPQAKRHIQESIKSERVVILMDFVKNIGDLLPATNGAGLIQYILRGSISDLWIGLGGLISSLISCYQIWVRNNIK